MCFALDLWVILFQYVFILFFSEAKESYTYECRMTVAWQSDVGTIPTIQITIATKVTRGKEKGRDKGGVVSETEGGGSMWVGKWSDASGKQVLDRYDSLELEGFA